MAATKEMKVILTLDDNGFSVKSRAAAASVQNLGRNVAEGTQAVQRLERAYNSVGGQAHRLITTMGMVRFALMDVHDIFLRLPLSVLKSAGEIERMTKLMEGLSSASTDTAKKLEAASNVKFLFNMAQNAPFNVKALGDAFVKLKTGGIDPTNGSLQVLIDSVARFGGTSDELHRAGIAIQQMSGKGVVSMEELRQQLGEAVPSALKAMADGMGVSMSELVNRVSKGTVEAKTAIEKMFFVLRMENQGAAARMMDTWTGMLERLQTKWELFKVAIASEGMFDGAKKALEELMGELSGTDGSSLARSIGIWLNDAVVNAVELIKKVRELWDWIVLAGKAWLAFKVAGIVAPVAAGAVQQVQALSAAITTAHANRMNQIKAEQAAVQAQNVASAQQLSRWIKDNNEKIAAERARLQTVEGINAQELASKIRNNEQVILAHRNRAAQLLVIEQEYQMKAMAMELEAERLARAKKAGTAAASREMFANAADVSASAAAVRQQREAYLAQAAAVGTSNAEMAKQIELMKAQAVATSPVIAGLERQNVALVTTVAKHEELAQKITKVNKASVMLGSAMGAVGGFLKSAIFSLNGLIIVLGAAALAWEHFAEKARAAARDAAAAASLQDKIRRGTAAQEDIKATDSVIAKKGERVSVLQGREEWYRKRIDEMKRTNGSAKYLKQLEDEYKKITDERLTLQAEIGQMHSNNRAAIDQVRDRQAELRAMETSSQIDREVAKQLKERLDQRQKLKDEFSKIANPSDKQQQDFNKKDLQLQKDYAAAEVKALSDQKKKYQDLVAAGRGTMEEIESWKKTIDEIQKKETDARNRLNDRDKTVPVVGKKGKEPKPKKGPKEPEVDPTDALLEKMKQDEAAIIKAKGAMVATNGQLVEVADLREQARQEIEQIMASDRRRYTVAEEGDFEKAVDQLTQRKLLEAALREQRSLMPRVLAAREQLKHLQDRVANGELDEQPDREESKAILELQKIIRLSPQAASAYQPLMDLMRERLQLAQRTDVAGFMLDQERSLRDMRIQMIEDPVERSRAAAQREIDIQAQKFATMRAQALQADMDVTAMDMQQAELRKGMVSKFTEGGERDLAALRIASIVDSRERLKAEHQKELNDIRWAYAQRIQLAKENGQDIVALQDQLNEMLLLKSKQHAEALKTPLERLVDHWKDTDERIRDMQANVAESFVDMLTDGLGEGRLKFDEWVRHILLEITNMNLKRALADPLNTIITGATDWMRGTGQLPALQHPETTYELSGFAAVNRQALQAGTALDAMATQGVAEATRATAQSALADGQATSGAQMLTASMYDAAAAANAFAAAAGMSAGYDLATGFAGVAAGSFGGLSGGWGTGDAFGNMDMGLFFADGGVMDPKLGRVPLRKYARGGIANRPQAAIYGEGDTPEAYVPLPDGRSIPVRLEGAAMPSVTLNVINQSGTPVAAQQGQPRFDGKQMVLDVVLTAMNQPGPFRDGMKGAMR